MCFAIFALTFFPISSLYCECIKGETRNRPSLDCKFTYTYIRVRTHAHTHTQTRIDVCVKLYRNKKEAT